MFSTKSVLAKVFAARVYNKVRKWADNPIETQQKVFKDLITQAKHTQFGKDHRFENIKNYNDFVSRVPIRDYELLKPYVERVIAGDDNVLWGGKPLYFAKTSGTTSGT